MIGLNQPHDALARYLGMTSEQMPTLPDYFSVRVYFWCLVRSALHLILPLERRRDLGADDLMQRKLHATLMLKVKCCCFAGLLKACLVLSGMELLYSCNKNLNY